MAATRYLFDRSFGADADTPAPPAPGAGASQGVVELEPIALDPAIFTQEDLDRVRAEALSFGRKQGAAEAAGTAEKRIAQTLEQIAVKLGAVIEAIARTDAEQARNAAALALAVIRKLFPEANRRHGLTEIAGVIDAVVGRIIDEPKITVRVAESLQCEVAGQLHTIAEAHGFTGQIGTVGDSTIAEGDCRIAWAGGGATRNAATIWREIDVAIGRTLGPIDDPTISPAADGNTAQLETRDPAAPPGPAPAPAECGPLT